MHNTNSNLANDLNNADHNTNSTSDLNEGAAHDKAPATAAARKKISDTVAMGLAGGGLLALAGAFLWRDLSLSPAHLVTAGATAGVAASLVVKNRRVNGVGILALFAATIVGGGWYAAERKALLLPALGITLLGAILNAVLAYPRARALMDRLRTGQIFALLTLSTLVATTASYFHFFTLGVEGLGRRLVLSLCWSLIGVAMVVMGGKLKEGAIRYSGYAFLLAALAKVLTYDTTHLSGSLRIGVLALSGAMLLGGALLNRRNEAQR